jgi:hypothetical protein
VSLHSLNHTRYTSKANNSRALARRSTSYGGRARVPKPEGRFVYHYPSPEAQTQQKPSTRMKRRRYSTRWSVVSGTQFYTSPRIFLQLKIFLPTLLSSRVKNYASVVACEEMDSNVQENFRRLSSTSQGYYVRNLRYWTYLAHETISWIRQEQT